MTAPELAAVRGHAAVLLTLLRDGAAREESLTAANSYKLVSALFCSPAALGLSDLIDVLSVGMGRGIQLHLCFARRQGRSPLALACANGYLAGAQAVTLPICKNAALRVSQPLARHGLCSTCFTILSEVVQACSLMHATVAAACAELKSCTAAVWPLCCQAQAL